MTTTGAETETPVPVTRGSKPPILSQKLDWIEGTFKSRTPINVPQILSQNYVETRPLNGYSVGSLFEDGRRLDVHPGRPEMGAHLTWTGAACTNCPMDCLDLVKHLQAVNFSFTRIDMAIDAIGFNLRPERATKEIKHGRCKSRAKKHPLNADARDLGYTQYVGTFASEICCRIYDKAAQMDVDEDWTRVELKVKGKRANQAAREIVRNTDFRAMVVAYADFPQWNEWREVMGANSVKLPSERQETNTERWLLDQCAPSLARVILLNPGSGFFDKFTDEVTRQIEQLSNNKQTVH
jgi:hypothetical protein